MCAYASALARIIVFAGLDTDIIQTWWPENQGTTDSLSSFNVYRRGPKGNRGKRIAIVTVREFDRTIKVTPVSRDKITMRFKNRPFKAALYLRYLAKG